MLHHYLGWGLLPWGGWNVIPLVFLNLIHILVQIGLPWCVPFRLLYQLPANKKNGEYEDHHVAEQEGRNVPTIENEDRITPNKSHDKAADKCVPRAKWLPPRFVRERVTGESLSFTGFLEFNESESHDRKVDQLGGSYLKWLATTHRLERETHQANKPAQYHGCAIADLQEA